MASRTPWPAGRRQFPDSGAAGALNLNTPFVEEHRLLERARKTPARAPNTFAGSEKEFFAQTSLPGKLAGFTLGERVVRGVEQGYALDAVGRMAPHLEGHTATHRVAGHCQRPRRCGGERVFGHVVQRVALAVVDHVARQPQRVDLRLPHHAVAQQAGQQQQVRAHQNSSVSTPACAAAS